MTTQATTPRIGDRTLIRMGRLLAGTAVGAAVIGAGIVLVVQRELLGFGVAHLAFWAIGIGSLAWVTIGAQARNGVVWTLAWAAFFAALAIAGAATFAIVAPAPLLELSEKELFALSPADLPVSAALALNPLVWAWVPAFFLVLTLGLLLFPDGRPPSRRWRWVGWLSVALMAIGVVGAFLAYRPGSSIPYDQPGGERPEDIALFLLILVAVVASIGALVVRYRRSSGGTRHQIRWIAWGGSFLAATMVVLLVNQESTVLELPEVAILVLLFAAEAVVILSFAVAITKYRLYDIDIVISKTVTYGALAVFITGLYVAIVAGIGTLVGRGDEPNLLLAIAAAAAVALLFEPVRSRLQRWANRLVYGERATPYEVLARFSERAATAEHDDEMMDRIPRLLVDGTSAARATLWVADDGKLEPAATWPERQEVADSIPGVDRPWSDPQADYSLPVEHDGELLGGISLMATRGETITPTEQELVENLAGGLGLALRNAQLTDDLRDQVEQLGASRERILTAADEARRDLERDLDMGPQQELVAVKVKLGVVRVRVQSAEAPKTVEVLGQLEDDVAEAIESVRDFARGVYPPLLEAEGLAAAVSAEADKAALPVTIEADGVGRYNREVETAAFFSILEALQNAAKYAEASTARVEIRQVDDRIVFEVSDDGRGFDPDSVDGGSGILGMTDRLDAAGGTLQIDSAPGRGTTIVGSIPV